MENKEQEKQEIINQINKLEKEMAFYENISFPKMFANDILSKDFYISLTIVLAFWIYKTWDNLDFPWYIFIIVACVGILFAWNLIFYMFAVIIPWTKRYIKSMMLIRKINKYY